MLSKQYSMWQRKIDLLLGVYQAIALHAAQRLPQSLKSRLFLLWVRTFAAVYLLSPVLVVVILLDVVFVVGSVQALGGLPSLRSVG